MTDIITKKYRRFRQENPLVPAKYALMSAKFDDESDEWEHGEGRDGSTFTREIDGFTVTLKEIIDSECPQDGDLGHYVQGANPDYDYDWNGNYPRPVEELPLNLPYTSFASGAYSQDRHAYPYFIPDEIEEQFDFYRRMGQSKQVAWLMTKQWVEERIKEWFGGPLTYSFIAVTASLNDVELGSAGIGTSYVEGDSHIFECVKEHGLVEEAVEEAKQFIRQLKEVPV